MRLKINSAIYFELLQDDKYVQMAEESMKNKLAQKIAKIIDYDKGVVVSVHRKESTDEPSRSKIINLYADVNEIKVGRWVYAGDELVCSCCGGSVSFSKTRSGWILGRYCQTCGAKMDGGEDNE